MSVPPLPRRLQDAIFKRAAERVVENWRTWALWRWYGRVAVYAGGGLKPADVTTRSYLHVHRTINRHRTDEAKG